MVIRVQLLSGDRHAALLPANETTWMVPAVTGALFLCVGTYLVTRPVP